MSARIAAWFSAGRDSAVAHAAVTHNGSSGGNSSKRMWRELRAQDGSLPTYIVRRNPRRRLEHPAAPVVHGTRQAAVNQPDTSGDLPSDVGASRLAVESAGAHPKRLREVAPADAALGSEYATVRVQLLLRVSEHA